MRYLLIIAVIFMACEGPVGPEGIQGVMGTDGSVGENGLNGTDGTDGTNGIDGQDGEQGIQGEPGPGTRTVISGIVISDDMNITFPDITTDIQTIPIIDIYVCPDGFECLAIPVTLEGVVTSTYFIGPQVVSLVNALSLIQVWASTGIYIIVMVE
ncbi:MAG: collagen-like protein [Candidatus Marinimicrobia bacterium]|nr:collagen-like protein [Candidatus Neomarinimicrobiota bacterium]